MVSSMNRAALKHGVTIETNGESCSDIAGVDAAGDADIGGAFDDGAAVGEDGQLIGIERDAQSELVGADGRDRAELARRGRGDRRGGRARESGRRCGRTG